MTARVASCSIRTSASKRASDGSSTRASAPGPRMRPSKCFGTKDCSSPYGSPAVPERVSSRGHRSTWEGSRVSCATRGTRARTSSVGGATASSPMAECVRSLCRRPSGSRSSATPVPVTSRGSSTNRTNSAYAPPPRRCTFIVHRHAKGPPCFRAAPCAACAAVACTSAMAIDVASRSPTTSVSAAAGCSAIRCARASSVLGSTPPSAS